jgi:hypothetical protein
MKQDSATIADFIKTNNSEWWAKSPIESADSLRDVIFMTD